MEIIVNGAKLRACRKDLNLTREGLAAEANVSVRYLNDLENDIPHNVGIAKLFPICMTLGVLVDDVVIVHFN